MTLPGKPQRKMVNIDVTETSGVDRPAHLAEGWVVMKSADKASPHMHLTDARYLTAQEAETARGLYRTDVLKSGESVQADGDASIRRDACGCLYLVTPEAVRKTADADLARELAQHRSTPDLYLTAEEIAYLSGDQK